MWARTVVSTRFGERANDGLNETDRGRFSGSIHPDAGRTQNRPLSLIYTDFGGENELLRYYVLFVGVLIFLLSFIRCFFPRLLYSGKLLTELDSAEKAKPFLLAHRINGLALGGILVLSFFLSSPTNAVVCLPLLAAVFISNLLCNIKYLDRWLVYKKQ